jgi:lipoyl(octanoyl) transferase
MSRRNALRIRPGATFAPMIWRLLRTEPLDGASNMAWDEALLVRARATGETVLRVYAWSAPTLSFGRNQSARATYPRERLAERGVDVVRRLTGGRAVLHWREITYSVTAPTIPSQSLGESYAAINRLLVDGLGRLGVDARAAVPLGRAPLPDGAPCFETPTAGELVVAGRKLVGSAQVRDDDALLQHGSVLVDDDQSLIADLAVSPMASLRAPATLRDVLGRAPSLGEAADALFGAVRAAHPAAAPLEIDSTLRALHAAALDRYLDSAWTWRR